MFFLIIFPVLTEDFFLLKSLPSMLKVHTEFHFPPRWYNC